MIKRYLPDYLTPLYFPKSLKPVILIFAITFTFAVNRAWGQYVSNSVTGNYEDSSSWQGTLQPPANGNDWRTLTIVDGAVITKSGSFTGEAAVTINGTFNVNGNYTSGYGGTTVNKTLSISNAFVNGNLTVGADADVDVKAFAAGSFDVKSGGTMIVQDGNCTLTQHSYIRDQGRVEVFGDFYLESNITIEHVGILIVHGNFNAEGNWGMNISGNLIVTGDFSVSNGTIQNDGNIVIGGDFTHEGGGFGGTNSDNFYILDPDAEVIAPGWTTIGQGHYGDFDDFMENESDNDDLMDLIMDIFPDYFTTAKITSESDDICQGDSYDLEIILTGNSPWEIKYSDGSATSEWITIYSSPHTITLTPDNTVTYTLTEVKSVDKTGIILGNPVTVTVIAGSIVQLTGLITANTICEGEPVKLSMEITQASPFQLTITETSSASSRSFNLTHEDLYFAGGNTYHFNIEEPPIWTDQGDPISGLIEYTYSITDFSDHPICPAVLSGEVSVNVYKLPETGPPYHIPNTHTP